jgi:hypothetical protein
MTNGGALNSTTIENAHFLKNQKELEAAAEGRREAAKDCSPARKR